MFGTIINAAAIIVGGLIGLLCGKGIPKNIEDTVHKAMGIAIIVIGINGLVSSMFTYADGKLSSSGELLLIVSLVLGALSGELLRLDDRLNSAAGKIEKKFHLGSFAASFVNGTLIYCVGAMAIIGALNDGLNGDSTVLLAKSALDGVSSVILGATMGVGVIFSAIPVFIYQGAISLLSGLLEPLLGATLLSQICAVGYALVLCIGINFTGMTKIKTANLLPSLLIPPLYAGIRALFRF